MHKNEPEPNQRLTIRRVDAGLALAVLVALLAAWPLLRAGFPRGTDAELHVFRTAELGILLRAGLLWPRWAADLYTGYGYPLFHYYAPLAYYLSNALTLALPGAALLGTRLAFALTFPLGAAGVYRLAERVGGARGGLIAAAVFLFAPYIYWINPYWRGDLPEMLALALAPWLFGALAALGEKPARGTFVRAVLLGAMVILAHNLSALVVSALAGAYVAWGLIAPPAAGRWRGFGWGAAALSVGLALAAFFWLPVLAERNAVQLGNLLDASLFDFRTHFVPLRALVGAPPPLDRAWGNPRPQFNAGLVQWALAALGAAALVARSVDSAARREGWFWLLAALGLAVLMLPLSEPVWGAVPGMRFLQFPWRLLGPLALALAVLAGAAAAWLDALTIRWRGMATGALVALPLLGALPYAVPPAWGPFGPSDLAGIRAFEADGVGLGTTATGDFLPAAVQSVPLPHPQVQAAYDAGEPIPRADFAALPEGVAVEQTQFRPTAYTFRTEAAERFTLRVLTFDWLGWRAAVDGAPVPITPSVPEGLITLEVPAGTHEVRVWLGPTAARTAGWIASLVGMFALVGLATRLPRRREDSPRSTWAEIRPAVVGIGLAVFLGVIGMLAGWPQPNSTGQAIRGMATAQHTYIEGGADLLGYTLSGTGAQPGDALALTLYWRAREPIGADYRVFVHLTAPDDPAALLGQSDKLHPGETPTHTWAVGRYIVDAHSLTLPADAPPGEYVLRTGLWREDTGTRQLILAAGGTVLGDHVVLDQRVSVGP